MDCQLSIASLCFRGICQVPFRTGQAQLYQDDSHISSRDVIARNMVKISNGNRVVNKNTIPFCAIGPDHALKQINRWIEVTGGLVGITMNENARNRFFLVSTDLV